MTSKRAAALPWWNWIVIVGSSLFMIVVTAFFPYIKHSFWKWSLFNQFNLAGETTPASWWPGILLFIVSLLAYEQAGEEAKTQTPWSLLALLFGVLSIDVFLSLHEKIGSARFGWWPLLPFALLAAVVAGYSIAQLWREGREKQSLVFLVAGLGLLAAAAPHEILEQRIHWDYWLQGPRLAFEEGSALAGVLLCLVGVIRQPRLAAPPITLHLPLLLILGFLLHLLTAIFVVHYGLLVLRGHPAIWYMTAVLFITALAGVWNGANRAAGRQPLWRWLALYGILFAAATVYAFLPRTNGRLVVTPFLSNLPLLLGNLFLFLISIYLWRGGRPSSKAFALLASLLSSLILGWYSGGGLGHDDLTSVLALVWAIFIVYSARQERRKTLSSPLQPTKSAHGA